MLVMGVFPESEKERNNIGNEIKMKMKMKKEGNKRNHTLLVN